MALSSTVFHVKIDLSDIDRGVYEQLDLRVARHPSESMRYMLTRVIAYCLSYEEGISFSKGLSTAEESALWVRDLRGDLQAIIEVGTPSAERLHKASKSVGRVIVYTQHDPALLKRAMTKKVVHRVEEIEVYEIPPRFLDALEALVERTSDWSMVRQEGQLYITVGDASVNTEVVRHGLG